MTIVILDARDAIELTTILECFAGWLHADADYARNRLPLYGTYSIDQLHADTTRLIKLLETTPTQRPARPGELCTCGRPAVVVHLTGRWGPTGWCGISDGGASGPCVFCNGPAHDCERCPRYQLSPQPRP